MPDSSEQTTGTAPGHRRYLKYTGLALAAVAGAAVMVVELGVARVLTPVFGGSITVWAIVIATTMLALAATQPLFKQGFVQRIRFAVINAR